MGLRHHSWAVIALLFSVLDSQAYVAYIPRSLGITDDPCGPTLDAMRAAGESGLPNSPYIEPPRPYDSRQSGRATDYTHAAHGGGNVPMAHGGGNVPMGRGSRVGGGTGTLFGNSPQASRQGGRGDPGVYTVLSIVAETVPPNPVPPTAAPDSIFAKQGPTGSLQAPGMEFGTPVGPDSNPVMGSANPPTRGPASVDNHQTRSNRRRVKRQIAAQSVQPGYPPNQAAAEYEPPEHYFIPGGAANQHMPMVNPDGPDMPPSGFMGQGQPFGGAPQGFRAPGNNRFPGSLGSPNQPFVNNMPMINPDGPDMPVGGFPGGVFDPHLAAMLDMDMPAQMPPQSPQGQPFGGPSAVPSNIGSPSTNPFLPQNTYPQRNGVQRPTGPQINRGSNINSNSPIAGPPYTVFTENQRRNSLFIPAGQSSQLNPTFQRFIPGERSNIKIGSNRPLTSGASEQGRQAPIKPFARSGGPSPTLPAGGAQSRPASVNFDMPVDSPVRQAVTTPPTLPLTPSILSVPKSTVSPLDVNSAAGTTQSMLTRTSKKRGPGNVANRRAKSNLINDRTTVPPESTPLSYQLDSSTAGQQPSFNRNAAASVLATVTTSPINESGQSANGAKAALSTNNFLVKAISGYTQSDSANGKHPTEVTPTEYGPVPWVAVDVPSADGQARQQIRVVDSSSQQINLSPNAASRSPVLPTRSGPVSPTGTQDPTRQIDPQSTTHSQDPYRRNYPQAPSRSQDQYGYNGQQNYNNFQDPYRYNGQLSSSPFQDPYGYYDQYFNTYQDPYGFYDPQSSNRFQDPYYQDVYSTVSWPFNQPPYSPVFNDLWNLGYQQNLGGYQYDPMFGGNNYQQGRRPQTGINEYQWPGSQLDPAVSEPVVTGTASRAGAMGSPDSPNQSSATTGPGTQNEINQGTSNQVNQTANSPTPQGTAGQASVSSPGQVVDRSGPLSGNPFNNPSISQNGYNNFWGSSYQQYDPYGIAAGSNTQNPFSTFFQDPYSQYLHDPYLQYPQDPFSTYPQDQYLTNTLDPYSAYPVDPYAPDPQSAYAASPYEPYANVDIYAVPQEAPSCYCELSSECTGEPRRVGAHYNRQCNGAGNFVCCCRR